MQREEPRKIREEPGLPPAMTRIAAEYEKLAFADPADGSVKPADKLRALAEYARFLAGEPGESGSEPGDGEFPLTVVYDYGDGDGHA